MNTLCKSNLNCIIPSCCGAGSACLQTDRQGDWFHPSIFLKTTKQRKMWPGVHSHWKSSQLLESFVMGSGKTMAASSSFWHPRPHSGVSTVGEWSDRLITLSGLYIVFKCAHAQIVRSNFREEDKWGAVLTWCTSAFEKYLQSLYHDIRETIGSISLWNFRFLLIILD